MPSGSPSDQSPVSEPTRCAANPGKAASFRAGFANGERTWEEKAHLVEILGNVLEAEGHAATRHKGHLAFDSGLTLLPQIVTVQPLDDGGAQICSTIEAAHPSRIPPGVFEFQHANGKDCQSALENGFQGWARTDLPALLDALEPAPKTCGMLKKDFPEDESGPKRRRRVILGPVSYYSAHPVETGDSHPPFCGCCLFTNSFAAFTDLVKATAFHGIRLYALRNESGEVSADCRVNGIDFPAGKEALQRYAASWPGQGFEFRKQYIILAGGDSGAA